LEGGGRCGYWRERGGGVEIYPEILRNLDISRQRDRLHDRRCVYYGGPFFENFGPSKICRDVYLPHRLLVEGMQEDGERKRKRKRRMRDEG
jgi:hypothetical protein